jgi:predicted N-acetyltransferase YhbS
MAVPERTPEQRRAASQRAVLARRRRAEVAAQLKTGGLSLPDVLELAHTDDAVAAMRVSAVLSALPRMGPRRSAEAMARLRVSPSRRLRGLGVAQRAALIELAAGTRSPTAPRAVADTSGGDPSGHDGG